MNQVDGVSDMVPPHCGSFGGRALKRNNGHCLTSGVLSGRKLCPSICSYATHFNFFPCAMCTLQAAAPELEPKVSGSV